jgi:hypothetical protein
MARLIAQHKQLQHSKGVAVQQIEAHLIDVKAEWDAKLAPVKQQIRDLRETGSMPLPPAAADKRVQIKAPPTVDAGSLERGRLHITAA